MTLSIHAFMDGGFHIAGRFVTSQLPTQMESIKSNHKTHCKLKQAPSIHHLTQFTTSKTQYPKALLKTVKQKSVR